MMETGQLQKVYNICVGIFDITPSSPVVTKYTYMLIDKFLEICLGSFEEDDITRYGNC